MLASSFEIIGVETVSEVGKASGNKSDMEIRGKDNSYLAYVPVPLCLLDAMRTDILTTEHNSFQTRNCVSAEYQE